MPAHPIGGIEMRYRIVIGALFAMAVCLAIATAVNAQAQAAAPEVKQAPIDAGIFAHQVRVTPDNRHVILVTRGNEVTPQKAEDPGGLKMFDYKNGVLSNQSEIAPNGGREYGPRHLDFHPSKPWMYVSIETQNKMHMHRMQIEMECLFSFNQSMKQHAGVNASAEPEKQGRRSFGSDGFS